MDDANSILSADVTALEAFVTDNDELLAIEENMGRFNIFDALRIARAEIPHSNFLAWLLSPSGSHGQGDLFLKPFLMDVLRQARANGMEVPISPVELDGAELHSCEVHRERWRTDLLIVGPDSGFVVAIEHKIDSGEHSDQLIRYRKTVRAEFPNAKLLFVFLTPDGDEASEEDWLSYRHEDLHRVFRRSQDLAAGSLGSDVSIFLTHYLSLIRIHMTDDSTLQGMCETVYANHRRAIDLIIQYAKSGHANLLKSISESLKLEWGDSWFFYPVGSSEFWFVPKTWMEALPQDDGRFAFMGHRALLLYHLRVNKKCFIQAMIRVVPCEDLHFRQALIERLIRDPDEFGLKPSSPEKKPRKWTTLMSGKAYEWAEDDGPDQELATRKTLEKLKQFRECVKGVEQAIQEVVAQDLIREE